MTHRISSPCCKFVYWILTTVLLSLSATAAFALDKEEAGPALAQIYQAQINSYYSINAFYNFSANQADQNQLAVMNDAISSINEIITELDGVLSNSAAVDIFNNARDSWNRYQDVLTQNIEVVTNTGYPDLRLADDMATFNIEFNTALDNLYDTVVSTSGHKPSDIEQTSREAATMISLMMTKYSARSTSTVSQVYTGGDTEITLDSLARDFDKRLEKLQDLTAENATASDFLDSAQTNWDFIRSSYINYNENRVNFIVNLYSRKIVNDIQDASS